MALTPGLLALGVVVVFLGLFYFMIRASKKEKASKVDRSRRLGFQALEEVPLELQGRIESLYQGGGDRALEIRNLSQRVEFGAVLYTFDLVDTTGDDTWLGSDCIGVISSRLALPRFSLTSFPEFNRDRGLGKMMDGLLDKVLDLAAGRQDLTRFEFPDIPGFDHRFVVFGRDEFALRELVSGVSWDSLAPGKIPLQVQGSGDFLVVEYSYTASSGNEFQKLQDLYQAATTLLRRLEK
jgi:hypothetical protein